MWFGDRLDSWTLCFEFPRHQRAIWMDRGYWGGPRYLEVRCDMNFENAAGNAKGFYCNKSSYP